ncbi:hypothetical protein [Hyalangium minutum]|uniref:B box-type domain-containing protein n=1 Tax=Hyalangium minutum TaxID=394096 RepID=A0A085W6L7_9BACT|nr:hypothetical protein [Hyalangium minutum]KFE63330.1 hypothetical protein DB31_2923 [Hyalangium minutum]
MLQGSGRCHYHPDRAGLGICVECRRVICRECTTQFEGINRCASCLEKRLKVLEGPAQRQEWSFGNVVLALLSVGIVYGGVRLAIVLAGY